MVPLTAKERAREYPLDRLNDMRALINYGPEFARQCLEVEDCLFKLCEDPRSVAVGRLFRMHTAILAALGAALQLTGREPLLGAFAARLGDLLLERVHGYPKSEDMTAGIDLPVLSYDLEAVRRQGLAIAWKASELADRLGMGEHNLYSHAPAAAGSQYRSIRRSFFFQRQPRSFPHTLVIGTRLAGSSSYRHDVPIFRGRALNLIPKDDLQGLELVVDGAPVLDSDQLGAVDNDLAVALRAACDREQAIASRTELDVRKMIVYSAELRSLAMGRWSLSPVAYTAIVGHTVTRALGLADDGPFAGPFFKLVKDGLVHIEPWRPIVP